jgi:hypothetical protein
MPSCQSDKPAAIFQAKIADLVAPKAVALPVCEYGFNGRKWVRSFVCCITSKNAGKKANYTRQRRDKANRMCWKLQRREGEE